MRMGAARSLLVVASIISGLSFGSTPSSAERNRDHRFSIFDIFDRPKESSYYDDYSRRRRYETLDEYFSRMDRRKFKRKRLSNSAQIIEEKPEPPLVYQPERLEILKAANLTEARPEGELAASIAHEVNQPLGAIVGNAERLDHELAQ